MPVRRIIILDQSGTQQVLYRYLLRADVPTARQAKYANPTYASPFIPIAPDTDPDASALKSGAVVESLQTWLLNPSVPIATVTAALVNQQATYQATVTNDSTYSRYGTYWNGTAWVAQGA